MSIHTVGASSLASSEAASTSAPPLTGITSTTNRTSRVSLENLQKQKEKNNWIGGVLLFSAVVITVATFILHSPILGALALVIAPIGIYCLNKAHKAEKRAEFVDKIDKIDACLSDLTAMRFTSISAINFSSDPIREELRQIDILCEKWKEETYGLWALEGAAKYIRDEFDRAGRETNSDCIPNYYINIIKVFNSISVEKTNIESNLKRIKESYLKLANHNLCQNP